MSRIRLYRFGKCFGNHVSTEKYILISRGIVNDAAAHDFGASNDHEHTFQYQPGKTNVQPANNKRHS
jgi:hypothetical protein